jgi:hypothetical protein
MSNTEWLIKSQKVEQMRARGLLGKDRSYRDHKASSKTPWNFITRKRRPPKNATQQAKDNWHKCEEQVELFGTLTDKLKSNEKRLRRESDACEDEGQVQELSENELDEISKKDPKVEQKAARARAINLASQMSDQGEGDLSEIKTEKPQEKEDFEMEDQEKPQGEPEMIQSSLEVAKKEQEKPVNSKEQQDKEGVTPNTDKS